jgi:isopentenyl-diphosphate delta-isomerase
MSEQLVLVDKSDRELGTAGVFESHTGDGVLHRAFTILVSNARGEVLVQKRSSGKRLWPSTWETSCSGHPRAGEDVTAAAGKRLREELGFDTPLETIGKLRYQARYRDIGSENELCYVLIGEYGGVVRPDPAEVEEFRWMQIEELDRSIADGHDDFAPWLAGALEIAAAQVR